MERRRESRLFIEAPGNYRRPGEANARAMYFSQISANGCRIMEQDCALEVGDKIVISLGSVDDVAATVRWRRENMAGVQFTESLEPPIVEFFAAYCGQAD